VPFKFLFWRFCGSPYLACCAALTALISILLPPCSRAVAAACHLSAVAGFHFFSPVPPWVLPPSSFQWPGRPDKQLGRVPFSFSSFVARPEFLMTRPIVSSRPVTFFCSLGCLRWYHILCIGSGMGSLDWSSVYLTGSILAGSFPPET